MKEVVLETPRLLLRLPRLEDAEAALDLYTDPVAMEFIGGIHPQVRVDPEYPIRRWIERWQTNGCGPFSIVRREDGRWLGRAGILVWDVRTWTPATFASAGEHAQPELGWALAREHWGRGYATESVRAVRDWAREEVATGRLVSVIAPTNIRSQRLAERLGATPNETVTLFDSGSAVVWEHPQ